MTVTALPAHEIHLFRQVNRPVEGTQFIDQWVEDFLARLIGRVEYQV